MTSAAKAYTFRTVFFMLGYVVALVLAVSGALDPIGVFWGFAEKFAEAPHIEGWWVYVVFWGLMGFMPVFIRSSR